MASPIEAQKRSRVNASQWQAAGCQNRPVVKPAQPASAAVAAVLRNLDPDLRLIRCWEMPGGVSAAITGIEAERLWLDGRLAAILDWENAAFGDPLADLGNARMEMAMLFGAVAQEELTSRYRALMPDLDLSALPHWDLYAALRPAGTVTDWGLSRSELARVRAGHAEFVQSALGRLQSGSAI